MTYTPATQDQLLAIRVNAGIDDLANSEKFAAAEPDMVEAIVAGIGEFAAGEWAPLNRIGDIEGAKLENGVVRLPDGFAEAYAHYVEQGWNAISGPVGFGGQGLPFTLSCNVLENLGTANMAFNLLPMLSVGAIESLDHRPRHPSQAGRLVAEEPRRPDDVGEFLGIGFGVILGGLVTLEEVLDHDVDAHVGALRAQNRRDQKL